MAKMSRGNGQGKDDERQSPSVEKVSSQYLQREGLSFSFDAGVPRYDYQVAIGALAANDLVGGSDRDYFWGLGGKDQIAGGAEDDNLFGDSGADVMVGGDGGDHLMGGKGDDRLYGGAEADALRGGEGDDFLDEGAGHGDLEGGAGDDTLVGGLGADAFAVDRESGDDVIKDFTAGPGMFDHLALRDLRWSDLSFQQTSAGVKVMWAGGSVLLEGVSQADLAQDDFMFAETADLPPGARVPSGPSAERPTPSSDGPAFGAERLPGKAFGNFADAKMKDGDGLRFAFEGDEAYQVNVGSMSDDSLVGGMTWDQLFGRDGNDTLEGEGGMDILQGDAGDDRLAGGDGMDRLDGGMGQDVLAGEGQADELMGAEGADRLDGGPGHDMINGGEGDDVLTGGAGADAFIVNPTSANDVVVDFEARGAAQGAFDHIALVDIMPGQVSVANAQTGALVSWDTNADGQSDGSVLLQGVYKEDLRQSDFMFNEEPGFIEGISVVGSYYVFPQG